MNYEASSIEAKVPFSKMNKKNNCFNNEKMNKINTVHRLLKS